MAPKPKTARLVFDVLVGPWIADGEGPFTDHVELDDASPELVRLASAAHAAGVLDVTEGLDEAAWESQEAGEAAYEAAQTDGRWQEGNLEQHALDQARAAEAQEISAGDVADAGEVLG